MAKAKKIYPMKKSVNPERRQKIRRVVLQSLAAILFIGGCGVGFYYMRRHVEQRVIFPSEPPRVVLLNRPAWMSDFLAEQIAGALRPAGTHSVLDHQMLVDRVEMLKNNPRISPWILELRQVRRVYGEKPGDTLEIDCDYRAPIALVEWQNTFRLVDGQGVLLPNTYTAQQVPRIVVGSNRKMNIRIVEGVQCPPPKPGRQWIGDDLLAGLDLVKLLYGQPYAEEIVKVDVSNFQGRIDPREAQLVLATKHSTEVRWGRPVNAKDSFIEVSTARKLDYLQRIFEEFKRVDGNHPWIDIRFDKITYPSVVPAAHADTR